MEEDEEHGGPCLSLPHAREGYPSLAEFLVYLQRFSKDSLVQLEEMRKNEDPRLSFATPEFKEAQRIFTDNFKVRGRLTAMVQVFSGCRV